MARPAGLARRHKPALVLQKRQGRVHPAVEPLRVPPARAREGEQRAVWGPHRIRRLGGWARVPERGRRTVRRHGPNLGMSSVLVLDNRRHDEGDAPPVGRDARVAERGEAVVVRRLEGMGGRLGGQTDRRTGGQKADRDSRQPAGVHVMLKRLRDGENYVLGASDATVRSAMPTARPPVNLTAAVTEAYAAPLAGSAPGPRPWCWAR